MRRRSKILLGCVCGAAFVLLVLVMAVLSPPGSGPAQQDKASQAEAQQREQEAMPAAEVQATNQPRQQEKVDGLRKYRERARSDDAQAIDEAFFHGNARALVISNVEPNKLRVGGAEFRVKRSPVGEGCFVYDPRTRFHGVERKLVWWIPEEGKAYPLNSPSKMVTPGLNWPREDGVQAPSTSAVVDYLFEGKAMSVQGKRAPGPQTEAFSVKEYKINHAMMSAPMSVSEAQAIEDAAKRFGITEAQVKSTTKKVQMILFANKWLGTPESEIRHASDWDGETP